PRSRSSSGAPRKHRSRPTCAASSKLWKRARSPPLKDSRTANVDHHEATPMKALCWRGKKDVAVERVPDPAILNPRDAIIRVTTTAICGSDLHLYDGYIPTMKAGDILGHEFMGEVVEVGRDVFNLKPGDRVAV